MHNYSRGQPRFQTLKSEKQKASTQTPFSFALMLNKSQSEINYFYVIMLSFEVMIM